jgi:hypothetical protein
MVSVTWVASTISRQPSATSCGAPNFLGNSLNGCAGSKGCFSPFLGRLLLVDATPGGRPARTADALGRGTRFAVRSVAHVQVRVTNPLAPFTNVANARLAEKIVERIAHHATIDPAGWEAFAAAEIKLALDAAARSPQ